ncbi:hypothetical protein ACJ73_07832, partial [Blastomyces percursus]
MTLGWLSSLLQRDRPDSGLPWDNDMELKPPMPSRTSEVGIYQDLPPYLSPWKSSPDVGTINTTPPIPRLHL